MAGVRFSKATILAVTMALLGLAPVTGTAGAQNGPTRVGVLLDGPSEFNRAVLAEVQREVREFFGREQAVAFETAQVRAADWTPAGARAALDQLFADPGVNVVVTLGPIGSNELAHRASVSKPAIAAYVIDATLQQLPRRGAGSGVRNLTYVDVSYASSRTMDRIRELVPFHHLAVLIDPGVLDAVPALRTFGDEQARAAGNAISWVPVTSSAAEALAALPAGVDAVYLAPLDRLSEAALDSLIAGLTTRRLPSFSYTGRAEAERGTLASYAPRDDLTRRARRVAGTLQRIRGGEDAGNLAVSLPAIPQLIVNLATARAIGYSPTWQTLTEAELLHEQAPAQGPAWTLAGVAVEAVRVNLSLRAAEREVAAGAQQVRQARGALLPQLQATTSGTMIRAASAEAAMGAQPERRLETALALSQVILSDRTRADRDIAGHSQAARVAQRRATELDVVLDAAGAYLDVLRARAIARLERANVRTTRSNLELAELRERTGASSLADVYRWRAELAQGRRRVLSADARAAQAQLELNRMLDRPAEESFQVADATAADPVLVTSEPRLLQYFATPETFAVFRDFTVAEGLAAAPELQALDASIAAQRRAATSAQRALWQPEVSLGAALSNQLYEGGAGTQAPSFGGATPAGAPALTWQLQLKASVPLFTGFRRQAARDQADIEVERLTLERQAAAQRLASTIRAALHQAGASWAGIEQARQAAQAARQNFELVTDAYGRGAVGIITLLDAQEAAMSADETFANATYDFLLDLMRVQRATGQFDFFRAAEERSAYFERLDAFYRTAGIAPAPR